MYYFLILLLTHNPQNPKFHLHSFFIRPFAPPSTSKQHKPITAVNNSRIHSFFTAASMASAFDRVKDMNDIKFKARRLNTLIKDYFPNEEHPFRDYSSAIRIKNEILINGLLSEFEVVGDGDKDYKTLLKWRRAVDLWEQRLMDLVLSNSTANCWFGVSFLGLTSQVIGFKRFEASYALWLQKLLPLVQSPAASDLVKVALWYSLSDLLTRLASGNFPDGKRDGIAFAAKLVQALLNSLSETNSRDALEGAATIICTVVTYFPTAVNRHSDAFEAYVVKKLFSEKDKDKLTILSQCLAELPKSKGDEMSWCLMIQKLLIAINMHLNYVFQGLEEDYVCDENIRRLIPPGKERPPPLGGREASPQAAEFVCKYLLLCCLKVLTSSYPVPVTVPAESILALIERVLMVDGSLAKSTYLFITVMQQESAFSQLPILHEHCLDMLAALIKLVGSQLLPHSPKIVRLLKEYFSRCSVPRLKVKIYSTLQIMLKSMGPGIGRHIRKFVIKNAFIDLEPFVISVRSRLSKASNMVSKESLLVPCNRKRKHSVATESPNLQQKVSSEVQATYVMIAALDTINTLLLKDCLSNDDNLKSQVDNLLIAVANASCKKRGWAKEANNTNSPNTHSPNWADIQVASLKSLKTSFIAPASVRPPHLAEGIMLFRRGALQAGTKIGDVCTDALASLEVVIHPRALSVADFASIGSNYAANGYQKDNTMGMVADGRDTDEDILFRSFLENEYESEIPTPDPNKKEDSIKQPIQNSKLLQPDIFTSKSDDSKPSTVAAQESMTVYRVPKKLTEPTDEVMFEQTQLHKPALHSQEAPTFPSVPSVKLHENTSQRATSDVSVSQASDATTPTQADYVFNSTTLAAVSTRKTTLFELFKPETTNDVDSFPDIVDADPDSDSN